MDINKITFRTKVIEDDIENIRDILHSSGFFYDFEIDVALELAQEYLEYGPESDYYFLFAEIEGRTVGYTCFGPIACTKHSFDLYWIGVHEDTRGSGLGKTLMKESEKIIKDLGGKGVYIETSSRDKYIPTQKFYDSCGCDLIARITDFYDEGDDKLIYKRSL
jgi:ribosomal protein S18 acetylase RimI-like enzyme